MRKVLGRWIRQRRITGKISRKSWRNWRKSSSNTDRQFIKLYEDFTKQLVSEQQFRMLSTHFEQEKKETTEEIEKLKTTADNLKDSTCKAEQLANEMVECAEIKELTTAIVNRLIEKIEVSEPQTIDGEKSRISGFSTSSLEKSIKFP